MTARPSSLYGAFLALLLLQFPCSGQLSVYFNRSVDTTLAYPRDNIAMGDRDFSKIVVERLAKAAYSIDMAIYNLNLQNVADALIDAAKRGVKVRVIGDRSNVDDAASRFRELVAAGIPVVHNRAVEGTQPLMHDKFFAIDAREGAPAGVLPVTITGSWNATWTQTVSDANNLLVIEDSAVAAAYRHEFEEMWGGSGDAPDTAAARFGKMKRAHPVHDFILRDGTPIELRFSPVDTTSRRINAILADARSSIHTATLTFTYSQFARTMKSAKEKGLDVRALIDNVNDSGSQFTFLKSSVEAYDWMLAGMLHHKYGIVDAIPFGSGGVVITGSHNWTVSAEIRNDENMVAIRSERIANLYLQEFAARYRESGGVTPFTAVAGVEGSGTPHLFELSTDPFDRSLHIGLAAGMEGKGELLIASIRGEEVARFDLRSGSERIVWQPSGSGAGLYLLTVRFGAKVEHRRVVLMR